MRLTVLGLCITVICLSLRIHPLERNMLTCIERTADWLERERQSVTQPAK